MLLCNLWSISDCFPQTSSSCLLMLDIMFGTSRPTRDCRPKFHSTLWELRNGFMFIQLENRKKYYCGLGCRRILYLENGWMFSVLCCRKRSWTVWERASRPWTRTDLHLKSSTVTPYWTIWAPEPLEASLRYDEHPQTGLVCELQVVHIKCRLCPGPKAEWSEPPGSEGSEPAQPGVW